MSTGAILNLTANRRTFHHDLNWPDATSIGATLKEESDSLGLMITVLKEQKDYAKQLKKLDCWSPASCSTGQMLTSIRTANRAALPTAITSGGIWMNSSCRIGGLRAAMHYSGEAEKRIVCSGGGFESSHAIAEKPCWTDSPRNFNGCIP